VHKFNVEWQFFNPVHSAWWRYIFAGVSFLISFFLRDVLNPWLFSNIDFVLFLPAILLTTFFAGLGPAILTMVLSGGALWYFFLPPVQSFRLELDTAVGLATFVLSSVVGIALVRWLNITIRRVNADLLAMTRLNQLSSKLVDDGNDMSKCLNEVIETAIAILGADKGNVQLYDSQLGALAIAAQRGFDDSFLGIFEHTLDDAFVNVAAMRSVERAIVEDVRSSDIFARHPLRNMLLDAGVRAVISSPLTSSAGNLLGMLSIYFGTPHRPSERDLRLMEILVRQTADYLERRRAKEVEQILTREIQHRSGNLFAVIQAIAHKSLSGDCSLAQAKEIFEKRLQALARANRQVTTNCSGGSIKEIVRLELSPFSAQAKIDGMNVVLEPKCAQRFSLALHELATNSAKYGALSNANGKVEISWTITSEDRKNRLKLKWQESGGPLVVAPTRHGFGTSLIKSIFPDVALNYAIEGLSCEIDLLLGTIEPSGIDARGTAMRAH
jgi:two-component sensor histidine kinase